MTQEINLYTEAGDAFLADFTISNDSGAPLNLAGYHVKASLASDYGSAGTTDFVVQILDSANGQVRISLSPSQTYYLGSGKFYFDCQYYSSNIRTKFIKGILTVYPTVTQEPEAPPSGSYVTKTVTINFPVPSYSGSFTIDDTQVNSFSMITTQLVSSGINADEIEMDTLLLGTIPGEGSFVITAEALPGPIIGDCTIQYTIYTP
jgi:hypothetical protein